jgi:hypothetical protein
MNAAVDKTKNLKRINLPLSMLVPNDDNPNEMSDAEFNLLADNFEAVGFIDPLFVRGPLPELGGKYRIIGGHHRFEVAKLYDFVEAPCTVIDSPDFDDDKEKFQVVRMNVIHGKMSPSKFVKMYEGLSEKYTEEVASQMFGFAEQEEFTKLVGQMAKSLPKEIQGDFKKAAEEVKTIDGLTKLLNTMFTKYGDTLPYGYMLLDYGGRESVWLRMKLAEKKNLLELAKDCLNAGVTLDSVVALAVQHLTSDTGSKLLEGLLAKATKVEIPPTVEMPIEDNLDIS